MNGLIRIFVAFVESTIKKSHLKAWGNGDVNMKGKNLKALAKFTAFYYMAKWPSFSGRHDHSRTNVPIAKWQVAFFCPQSPQSIGPISQGNWLGDPEGRAKEKDEEDGRWTGYGRKWTGIVG
jgi:hypothetical protein